MESAKIVQSRTPFCLQKSASASCAAAESEAASNPERCLAGAMFVAGIVANRFDETNVK
ncbi:hypothetical protein [Bradyrhizobium elkanii]|uniref:hypothetical protein n=1 Tax=Bradyrhizobium elkanii TaxID=29448 RepID=UPI00155AE923|nr:hypothetical protein [Bradyrhizobium elkanii]